MLLSTNIYVELIEIWGRDVNLISSTETPNEEAEEFKLFGRRSSKKGYNFKF